MPGPPRHVAAFEGAYGALYDRAISTDALRRLAPLGFGAVTPLLDLDRLAATLAGLVPAGGTLLDVPSGGAPLLPRLARAGMTGRVVAVDLSAAMLDRARARAARVAAPALEALRADALALPLGDASVDCAVSLNGVHCLPDPARFAAGLGRVVRPGGAAVVVTLVAGARDPRAAAVIAAGRLTGILPGPPPDRAALHAMFRAAGFTDLEDRGGDGLAGLVARRPPVG